MSEKPAAQPTRRRVQAAVLAVAAGALMIGAAGTASAQDESVDTNCSVPGFLHTVAANVDPDSLEGCDYFEDPNFHDNRREAGTYNPNGLFTLIFGR